MPRFHFRLDGLLRLRKHQEDNARVELAEAQRKVLGARSALEDVVAERSAAARTVSPQEGEQTVTSLQTAYAHLQILGKREVVSRSELAACHGEHEERRDDAVAALRAHQTLQRLQERALERHQHEERRAEGLEADEAGNDIAARRILAQRRAAEARDPAGQG